MLKPSVCIEMFWGDVDFAARIPRVAALGYRAFEFWAWWNKDLDAVERVAKDAGLDVAACCVKTAFSGGVAPMLAPAGKEAFVKAVKDCLPVSEKLGCKRFIVTTGNELPGVPRAEQHAACVAALKAAAPVAEDAGITLVLEPLNLLVDHAGYYLSTSAEGFEMLDEVGSPAVKLLFDIYHQQITEGNLTPNIVNHIAQIGHFHVANHPGRHEPAGGEIDYAFLFRQIARTPYDGYLGLEFSPSDRTRTEDTLRETLAMVQAAS
ncbi:MAG: Hydroxypyruvate isomerase [Candidatus Hydrogenedentes bacterium]|nr:Hydroxypyruvate isomerase [Candidatus Hydrogenedentota bacterium]